MYVLSVLLRVILITLAVFAVLIGIGIFLSMKDYKKYRADRIKEMDDKRFGITPYTE